MYSTVKSIRGKCYTEVVRFSEGPLLEVLLYKVVCHVSSSTTVVDVSLSLDVVWADYQKQNLQSQVKKLYFTLQE